MEEDNKIPPIPKEFKSIIETYLNTEGSSNLYRDLEEFVKKYMKDNSLKGSHLFAYADTAKYIIFSACVRGKKHFIFDREKAIRLLKDESAIYHHWRECYHKMKDW